MLLIRKTSKTLLHTHTQHMYIYTHICIELKMLLLLLLLLLSHFSCVQLCVTPWTEAYQAPPTMGFSRQEYWNGLPFSSP